MKFFIQYFLFSILVQTVVNNNSSCKRNSDKESFIKLFLKVSNTFMCTKNENITDDKPSENISNSYTSRKCRKDICVRANQLKYQNFREWLCCLNQTLKDSFPIDSNFRNNVRVVSNSLFSIVKPTPLKNNVKLVSISEHALSTCLDLDPKAAQDDLFLNFVNGDNQLEFFPPALAHRYGGHQFGYWAGQLGDGRAVLLGDYVNSEGQRWELQLKGSGKTPYSRSGDGRAVVRSSVREFLASEAMYHLGIPTSRAAAILVSDDEVIRDQFYDNHPLGEKTAIVLRLAPTWFRIGTLEILTKSGEVELLKKVLDYLIITFFKGIDIKDTNKYVKFYSAVVRDTAHLIAQWQAVGFAHGVCNTDNFSILSITIDYGPFGFLDKYNPKFVPNFSDDEERYSFEKQPDVGFFNLEKLLSAIMPVLDSEQTKTTYLLLNDYNEIYKSSFLKLFSKKFGLNSVEKSDEFLIATFLKILQDTQSDYTMSFRQLGEISYDQLATDQIDSKFWALKYLSSHSLFPRFLNLYKSRLELYSTTDEERQYIMNNSNPVYILRNWIAQKAISEVENGNFDYLQRLKRIFENPFMRQKDAEDLGFAKKPPYWASYLHVSCSS